MFILIALKKSHVRHFHLVEFSAFRGPLSAVRVRLISTPGYESNKLNTVAKPARQFGHAMQI